MKHLFMIIFVLMAAAVSAQDEVLPTAQQSLKLGFLSYDSALVSMPQYALVKGQMKKLREAYEAEVKRAEQEFNQKYESFLDGQRNFPRTILLKRQNELQELMQKNIDFRQQGKADLQQAEAEAMAPLRERLRSVLADVARRHGFALVVNTDANACPFIDPAVGVDIQQEVADRLRNGR